MKTRLLLLISILSVSLTACSPQAEIQREDASAFVTVDGSRLVEPGGETLILRGINLGNWLVPEGYMFKFDQAAAPWQIEQVVRELIGPAEARAFWDRYRDVYITREDIAFIKSLGMNVVRVPFNYKQFTPEDYPEIWAGPGFDMLDRVIEWSREEGLYVLLDLHAAPCGQTGENIDDSIGYPWLFESEECQARTVDFWRKLAERYRDEPIVIGYDLLNEPIPHYPEYEKYNVLLEPLYRRITTAIREVDPYHLIFLGGAQWDSNFKVFGAPFDDRLVYTFHKYWTEPTAEVIQEYVAFRDTFDVPLFMGESGENTDEWIATFTRTLEEEKIGWTYWPYKKMDATSCIRSIERPPFWDEIEAYAERFGASFEEKRKARPPAEHIEAALEGLLVNSRFENTRSNEGYIRALGLEPVQ